MKKEEYKKALKSGLRSYQTRFKGRMINPYTTYSLGFKAGYTARSKEK